MGKSGDGMRFCGFAVLRLYDCSEASERAGGWLVGCCGQGPAAVFVQSRVGAPGGSGQWWTVVVGTPR